MTDETFELTKFTDSMSSREQPGTKPDTEVGDIAPIYQTLPGDESHSHYKNKEVRFPGSQSSASSHEAYPSQGPSMVSQGSIRRHAQNDLYVDTKTADDEYRHATLQQDGTLAYPQSYSGAVSTAVEEPAIKYSSCRLKPKDMWLCAFTTLTLLIAVAALALVLLLWFGVYTPSCDCGDTEDLRRQISTLQQQLAANVSQLREDVGDLQGAANASGAVPFLADVELYESCSTSTEGVCTLSPDGFMATLGFTACETPDVVINNTETYILEAHCEREELDPVNPELNPVTAILQADKTLNVVRCQCWVVVPGDDDTFSQHRQVVHCNLVVTRCPRVQTLFFNTTTLIH